MIITMTLNPAIDKTLKISEFSVGAVNRIESVRTDIGGKGINVARTVRNLGYECLAMGLLSGQNGLLIEARLKEMGIKCDFIYTPGESRTNIKIADLQRGTYTDLNEDGLTVPAEALATLEEHLIGRVGSGDIVVFSGSVPANVDRDIYRKWISIVKALGADTILDAEGELFSRGVLAAPGAVKPNMHELETFCSMPLEAPRNACAEAEKLLKSGISTVLVSMGSKGALLVQEKTALYSPGLPTRALSTVGAGDAMVAALAIARQRQDTSHDTLCLAIACGTAAVMTEGTQPPSSETVIKLVSQVIMEPVAVIGAN
jgi:1-phosphofructokinase